MPNGVPFERGRRQTRDTRYTPGSTRHRSPLLAFTHLFAVLNPMTPALAHVTRIPRDADPVRVEACGPAGASISFLGRERPGAARHLSASCRGPLLERSAFRDSGHNTRTIKTKRNVAWPLGSLPGRWRDSRDWPLGRCWPACRPVRPGRPVLPLRPLPLCHLRETLVVSPVLSNAHTQTPSGLLNSSHKYV